MSGFQHFWQQGDLITRSVALLLLLMSISAWVVIFWKGWLLRRVRVDIARAVPAFWGAADLAAGREQLTAFDREGVLEPLLAAATATRRGSACGAVMLSAARAADRRAAAPTPPTRPRWHRPALGPAPAAP